MRQPLDALELAWRALATVPEVPVPGLVPEIPKDGPGHWLGISGGPWVYPDRWRLASVVREAGSPAAVSRDDLARIAHAGERAARDLAKAMKEKHGVQLSAYLAVVVQDLDSMGRFLSGDARDAEGKS